MAGHLGTDGKGVWGGGSMMAGGQASESEIAIVVGRGDAEAV